MRFSILFIFALACLAPVCAQKADYTTEKVSLSKPQAKTCEEIEVIFQVDIQPDWYIYSSDFPAEGPLKAEFAFMPDASYQLVGKVQAISPKQKYDETWEGNVSYFEKKAEFRQKIKVLSNKFNLTGFFSFQTCSNVTGQCLAPEKIYFTLTPKNIKIAGTPCK
jgi:hypothetical protein